jgi:hypothetical protein
MPCHRIEVTEYECAKCSHRWINRVNGKDSPKPTRCTKCKRWDWEEGHWSLTDSWLRRDLRNIESVERGYDRYTWHEPTDLYYNFINISLRPTTEELGLVLKPTSYIDWKYEGNNYKECKRMEGIARQQLMQHIIDSRPV